MMEYTTTHQITEEKIKEFATWLLHSEHSAGTIEKYLRDVQRFAGWLKEKKAEKKNEAETAEKKAGEEKAGAPAVTKEVAVGEPSHACAGDADVGQEKEEETPLVTKGAAGEELSHACMVEECAEPSRNAKDAGAEVAKGGNLQSGMDGTQTKQMGRPEPKAIAASGNELDRAALEVETVETDFPDAEVCTAGTASQDSGEIDAETPLVTKEAALAWKEDLIQRNYAPTTVNSMLAAINAFFRFAGWKECTVKALKVQKKVFRDASKNLTKEEYERLVQTALDLGKVRLALLMETLCATGIRVSEVRYITVEAINAGRTEVRLKGKVRTILLPGKLCKKLRKYAKKETIASGEIFITRTGNSLSRRQIWAEMKSICLAAGVEPSKVFPHNLRHLFARTFFKSCKDLVKLADLMGHSSVETTRIYLISTGEEHERFLNQLQLVS